MSKRALPHSRVKAERRVLSPDEQWAAEIRDRVVDDNHPFQREALLDPSRFKTLLVGRGGGKTTEMRADAIISLTSIRRGKLVYLAPTRGMAEELMWLPLKDSIEFYGLMDDFSFNETKFTCTCKRTGAVLKLLGVDDSGEVDKLRGRPFDRVYIDEASLYPPKLLEDLLDRAIEPRLGEREGRITMGGTPGHILAGPFYDFTRPGASVQDDDGNTIPLHRPYADRDKPEFAGWNSWSSHHWTLKSVAELPDAATLYPALVNLWAEALRNKKRKLWSDQNPVWLREYLGIWASDGTLNVFQYRPFLDDGTPWNQWDPSGEMKLEGIQQLEASIRKLREMGLQDLRYVYGGDMGSALPYALNVFAFSPRDPLIRLWQVMGFERTRMRARLIADLHLGPEAADRVVRGGVMEPLGGALGATGWPDGMVMDSDQATIDELSGTYGLPYKKADRNPYYKKGAIELTNGNFIDGRIKVIRGSPLEKQLETLQWRENKFGHVEEDPRQASHCLVAGTMVMTDDGERPIDHVNEGDRVWTRGGLRRVTFSGRTGTEPTWRARLTNGRVLQGTRDHLVWTEAGWVQLASLTPSDTLTPWASTDLPRASSSAAGSTPDTRRPPTPRCGATGTADRCAARLHVLDVTPTGKVEPVFDLTVDGDHEFFANGVLVHNSSDGLIYSDRLVAGLFESGVVEHEAPPARPGAPPPAPPPVPEQDQGIYPDPLRTPLHYSDPWGNL
jgi:hypothetical protein